MLAKKQKAPKDSGGVEILNTCPIMGPTEPGCSVEFQPYDSDTYLALHGGTASGSEPLWTGQTYSNINAPEQYFCPTQYPTPGIRVYIPEFQENAFFLVGGTAFYKRHIGYSVYGHEMAEYQLPNTYQNSNLPFLKYRMLGGGTIKVRCSWKRVRTGLGFRVEIGKMLVYDFDGDIVLNDGTGGGNGDATDRGYGYGANGSYSGGQGSDAENAVERLLNDNVCTPGYEIWIDGAMACTANGTRL